MPNELGPYTKDARSAKLRQGWTTGACATAATKAAFGALLTGRFADPVNITLPKGETPGFALAYASLGAREATAAVIKDAGDDPDVTHGALIRATVRHGDPGLRFMAGEGVGVVTRPGLPIPPGEAAINPVPRQMMTDVIHTLARAHRVAVAVEVEISIPGGAELAQKTWNPRLGIEGGLSILGTTGIVRPFSCAAWIASIHRGIDVARAMGLERVVGSTGNRSEETARSAYPLPDQAFLDMGDFVGGMLKYLRRHPLPRLTIAGGFGKMSKLAQGAMDLHSRRSQVDVRLLADWAGLDEQARALLDEGPSAARVLELAGPMIGQVVAERARNVAALACPTAAVECIVIDRAGRIIGRVG